MEHQYIITISSTEFLSLKELLKLIRSCKCDVVNASINNLYIGHTGSFTIKVKWAYAAKFESGFLRLYNGSNFSKSIIKIVGNEPTKQINMIKYKASLVCPTQNELFQNIYEFFVQSNTNVSKYKQTTKQNQTNANLSCVDVEIDLPIDCNLTKFRENFTNYFDDLDLDIMLEACGN